MVDLYYYIMSLLKDKVNSSKHHNIYIDLIFGPKTLQSRAFHILYNYQLHE